MVAKQEYLRFYSNYLCSDALCMGANMCKLKVSTTNITLVIDINVTKWEQTLLPNEEYL